ncbi:hypothetical protein HanHA300_Chr14g0510421 [Helianthus annuus]|nr:hypothetical protein HanHA300_Chr14g0510421 [Helianthus annuus]KAJ0484371.1 hypothetical protein HanHA89_Chr14g0543381 [Helianthus annuus]KAJ0658653.1 hypothetical protein HanOQP8_Chr14g0510651 [Helianthus annuus]KAJ0838835.1 hypothetical protein HanPSC8_Chr14g0599461 [Helianthus annuus]
MRRRMCWRSRCRISVALVYATQVHQLHTRLLRLSVITMAVHAAILPITRIFGSSLNP